jgi:hypothetical protein
MAFRRVTMSGVVLSILASAAFTGCVQPQDGPDVEPGEEEVGEAGSAVCDEDTSDADEEAEISASIQWNGKVSAVLEEADASGVIPGDEACVPIVQNIPSGPVTAYETFSLAASAIVDGCAAKFTWSSNLDGAIGEGDSLGVHGLSPGNHVITLTVTPQAGPGCDAPKDPCSVSHDLTVTAGALAAGTYCGRTLAQWQANEADGTAHIFDASATSQIQIVGSPLPDLILGNGASNVIFSLSGNDCVYGYGGNDLVKAGSGLDVVYGGLGNDSLRGQDGNDALYGEIGNDSLGGGAGNDLLVGDAGADALYGDPGDDTLYGGLDPDTVEGGDGADILHGHEGADTLRGGRGADTMYGGSENDTMYGGADNDQMYGGSGNDRMDGEGGQDMLSGEGGRDFLQGNSGNDSLFGGSDNDMLCGWTGDDHLNGGSTSGGFDNDSCNAGSDQVSGTVTQCENNFTQCMNQSTWDTW